MSRATRCIAVVVAALALPTGVGEAFSSTRPIGRAIGRAIGRPTGVPANDSFAAAATLAAGSVTATGSTVGATKQTGEPAHGGNSGGHSVWWRWTPSVAGLTTIDTCGSDFDTLLGVYTGTNVQSLATIAADDDGRLCGMTSLQSSVYFNAVVGTTYFVAVDGYNGAVGTVALRVIGPPSSHDNFANAEIVPPTGGTFRSSTTGATKEPGEPAHAGNAGGHSIWWTFTPTRTATTLVETCGSSFNTLLGVYTGTRVAALTAVASNDDSDACGAGSHQSAVSFHGDAGTTYAIAVDGFNGAAGSVVLDVTTLPGDDFADSVIVPPAHGSFSADTLMATKEPGEPDHAGNAGGHSMWWTWTPPSDSTVFVYTCGSTFDTLLGVYTGSAVDALTEVASNNDSDVCGAGSRQSAVTFDAVAGTAYSIAVDGFGGATGTVLLHVTGPDVTPPDAPTISSTASGNGWVEVSWDPPASDGGAPVSTYTVTLSTGETTEVSGDGHAATFRVSNGVARTAHVTATNATGTGPPSAESGAITASNVGVDVTTTYDGKGNTQLANDATFFGQSAEDAQRTATGTLAYLIGLAGLAGSVVSDAGATGAASYTTAWAPADQGALATVMAQYSLSPSEAQEFSVRVVAYLLSLDGS